MIYLSPLKKISIIILSFHFFIIVWAVLIPIDKNNKTKTSIVVRSIIEENKIMPISNKQTTSTKPKKINPTPIKKTTNLVPKETKKVIKSKAKPAITTSDSLFVPKLNNEIKTTNNQSKTEKISFEDILQYLESIIILPIKSSIKAKITIQPDGKIKEIIVLEGEDENKNYLIQTLEGYMLPIDNAYKNDQELVINFRGL